MLAEHVKKLIFLVDLFVYNDVSLSLHYSVYNIYNIHVKTCIKSECPLSARRGSRPFEF